MLGNAGIESIKVKLITLFSVHNRPFLEETTIREFGQDNLLKVSGDLIRLVPNVTADMAGKKILLELFKSGGLRTITPEEVGLGIVGGFLVVGVTHKQSERTEAMDFGGQLN